jgi:hypothetical protein
MQVAVEVVQNAEAEQALEEPGEPVVVETEQLYNQTFQDLEQSI